MSGEESQNHRFGQPGWKDFPNPSHNKGKDISTLSYFEQEKLQEWTERIMQQYDFLSEEEIQSAILEHNFDQEKIDHFFEKYQVDEKYEKLPAFQWKQVDKKEFSNKKSRGSTGYRGRGGKNYNTQFYDEFYNENQQYDEGYDQYGQEYYTEDVQ